MENALCNVSLSLGFGNCLVLPLPVTVIHLSSSFSPFLFLRALAFLGFLCSHSRGLRYSSDELLLELALYADSVYSVSVLLFSIIELRYKTEVATE